MLVTDIVEGIFRNAASDNHLFEHLRSCGVEHLSFRGIQRNVRLGRDAELLKLHRKFLASQFTPAEDMADVILDQSLHSIDL